MDADAADLLANAREDAETFDVEVEVYTILSHRRFEEIFDAARAHKVDLVVMGWGEHGHARVESRIREMRGSIPCDFLVLRDRGFDPRRILVPTAGGPDSELSAEVAHLLQREYDAEVTVLHVADDLEAGDSFLREWAKSHGLKDAILHVETGSVETAIERAAQDVTLVVIGATERGLFSRLVKGSFVSDVVDDLECSVLLAERPTERSLWDRLFKEIY